MATRFWYDENGTVLRSTSDKVESFPGAVGFTETPPTSAKQKWNGSNWDPLPPASDEDRIDEAFPQTDVARVIFEAFLELANAVRALKIPPEPPLSRGQLRDWLKAKLP